MTEGTEGGAEYGRPNLERSILNEPSVRVSCASFARIQDDAGRYLLLVNKDRKGQGMVVLTPIGGALEMTDQGKEDITSRFSLTPDDFEKGNDLRFRMGGSSANDLREWFLTREGREEGPGREVVEELVEESHVLSPTDLPEGAMQTSLAGYQTEVAQTTRTGQAGALTLRLLEVHDVRFPKETMTVLQQFQQTQTEPTISFVSAEEIAAGRTTDGIDIAPVAKTLLNPKETIEQFT